MHTGSSPYLNALCIGHSKVQIIRSEFDVVHLMFKVEPSEHHLARKVDKERVAVYVHL